MLASCCGSFAPAIRTSGTLGHDVEQASMMIYSRSRRQKTFLRSYRSRSYSSISQHFTEPDGSLPCSQDLATVPYPDPNKLIRI
jgi:hypothetical protein